MLIKLIKNKVNNNNTYLLNNTQKTVTIYINLKLSIRYTTKSNYMEYNNHYNYRDNKKYPPFNFSFMVKFIIRLSAVSNS